MSATFSADYWFDHGQREIWMSWLGRFTGGDNVKCFVNYRVVLVWSQGVHIGMLSLSY